MSFKNLVKEFGHVILYGGTQSGKTTFMQYIIETVKPPKVFVFVPEHLNEDWFHDERIEVVHNWKEIKRVRAECKKLSIPKNKRKYPMHGICYIILDDFNDQINVNHDHDYKDLFTNSSHTNAKIFTMAHTYTSVGTTARAQCDFCVLMCKGAITKSVKEIAMDYKLINEQTLVEGVDNAFKQDKYNALILNKNESVIGLHKAKVPETNVIHNEIAVVPHPQSALMNGTANLPLGDPYPPREFMDNMNDDMMDMTDMPEVPGHQYLNPNQHMYGHNPQLGNKYAGRDFQDNSKNIYNTQYKMQQKQAMEAQMLGHHQKMTAMRQTFVEEKQARKFNTIELLYKPELTNQEIDYILTTFNKLLRTKKPYTRATLKKGVLRFARMQCRQMLGTWVIHRFDPVQQTFVDKTAPLALTGAKLLTGNTLIDKMEAGISLLRTVSKT